MSVKEYVCMRMCVVEAGGSSGIHSHLLVARVALDEVIADEQQEDGRDHHVQHAANHTARHHASADQDECIQALRNAYL